MLKRSTPSPILWSLVLLICTGIVSCTDDDSDLTPVEITTITPPIDPVVLKSTIELLSDTFILYETLKNNVVQTSGGTDSYEFSRNRHFNFKSASGWSNIGYFSYSADSSMIDMNFNGLSTPVGMTLSVLNETDLQTSFVSGGDNFLYKYSRK